MNNRSVNHHFPHGYYVWERVPCFMSKYYYEGQLVLFCDTKDSVSYNEKFTVVLFYS